MKKISLFVLCFLAFFLFAYAEETAGLITDLKGTVSIIRGTEKIKAEVGSEVLNNDKIKCEKESSADILMTNGDYLTVKENEEKTITLKIEPTRAKENKESSEFFSSDTRNTILANPVSLREGEEISSISPRSTTISKRPHFFWTVDPKAVSAAEFTVILTDSNGKELFKNEVKGFEFEFPKELPDLIPDKIYTWIVMTKDEEFASEETYFKILPEEKINEFSRVYGDLRKKYITSENTLNISYGSYLIEQKMYSDAFYYFNQLVKKTPESKYVHQMLAITHLKQKLFLPYNQEILILSKIK